MVGRHAGLPAQLRPMYEELGPSSINVLTVAASPLNWRGVLTGSMGYNQGAL